MIQVDNLVKAYSGVLAVDRISFQVGKGEIAGFLGPNGAGKTTTMRILTGFVAPTSGAASVAGLDVVRRSMEVRRRVGYLPESNPLYAEMRVGEYLEFRSAIKGVPRGRRKTRAAEVMERCGIADRRRSIIQHLSKGLRQRVGLADAIVHDPEVLILDEPTIGLDPLQVREVRDLIRELGKDRTVLLSTHILTEVEKVCARVLIIHRGRLVAAGTPAEIAGRLMKTGRIRLEVRGEGRAIQEKLEAVPHVARIAWAEKGAVNVYTIEASDGTDIRPEVYRCCASNGLELCELAYERLSLEDIFAELTWGKTSP